jgi:tRNA uridine 5-carboxymethylaminomethyl modification enzyme
MGVQLGLASAERGRRLDEKLALKTQIEHILNTERVLPGRFAEIELAHDERPPLSVWLRRPEARIEMLLPFLEGLVGKVLPKSVLTTVQIEIKYEGYLQQQDRQVERLHAGEAKVIMQGFDYSIVPGLSKEIQQKLDRVQPRTLGAAARIPGVTPAAIAILDVYLDLKSGKHVSRET